MKANSTHPERVICIVGVRGEMGDWFRRFFLGLPGYEVTGLGRRPDGAGQLAYETDSEGALRVSGRGAEETVRTADVVMISAPLLVTPALIQSLAAWSEPDQLWCDIASIKSGLYEPNAYANVRAADIVSFHPVFGGLPRAGPVSIKGRVVVLCRHTGEAGYQWLRDLFAGQGAELIECSWEEHDRQMAIVQGLTHLSAIALGATLQAFSLTTRDAARFTSPLFRLFSTIAERVLSGSPELYAGIQFANARNVTVAETYANALGRLIETVRRGVTDEALAAFHQEFALARQAVPEGVRQQNAEWMERMAEWCREGAPPAEGGSSCQ